MLVFLYMCLSSKVSLILYFVDYKHLKFNNWYVYPDWAYALGWMMALTSFAVLILTTAGQMCHTSGTFMQVGVVKIPPFNCQHIHCTHNHDVFFSICPSCASQLKNQPGGGRQPRM